MEKAATALVHDFSNSSDDQHQPDFDGYPILKRLLQRTFEPELPHSHRRTSWLWSLGLLGLISGVVWTLVGDDGRSTSNGGLGSSSCLWRTPDWLRDLTRTPVNCSVCADLTEVERISGVVDRAAFVRTYVDAGRPVVITDATDRWLAKRSFSFDFFRELYLNKSRANCQFFRYKSKFQSLQDVFETASVGEGEEPWYVGWSNCDGEIAEILRAHYDRPYFLPELSESAHTDWIFMGSPAYGAHLHVDDVDYPSWQAQIHGRKQWSLYPPPECLYRCPRRYLDVIMEPGDTIVVDTNWWYHKTLVVGDQLSISIGSEFD